VSRKRSSDDGKVPGSTPQSSQQDRLVDFLAFLRQNHYDILMRLRDAGLLESSLWALLAFLQNHPEVLAQLDNPIVLEGFIRSFAPVTESTLPVSPEDDDWFERLEASVDAGDFPPLPGESMPSTNLPLPSDSEPLQYSSLVPIPEAPLPGREINLGRCHVTRIKEQGSVETFLSEERKTYQNGSKTSAFTKQVSVSNTISQTVTIQWGKLKTYSAGAGVTLVGLLAIQSQVQQQLSKSYSIEMQNSITISETSTITVSPGCTVEHVIKWKQVALSGAAVLGETPRFSRSVDLAEVPYLVPLRLTYSEDLTEVQNDVQEEIQNETKQIRKRWRRSLP
jgi:hypothetical protein